MTRTRPALLILLLLLSGADAVAVAVATGRLASGSAVTGLMIHLALALAAGTAVLLYFRKQGEKSGHLTLATLVFLFGALTPVLGFMVGGWLAGMGSRNQRPAAPYAGMQIGNPLHGDAFTESPTPTAPAKPLLHSLHQSHATALRTAAPSLRRRLDRRSVGLLRALRDHQDARAQLYAQSALSTLSESRERQLAALRAGVKAHPESVPARERLACALLETADSSLRNAADSRRLVEEARDQFAAALERQPSDGACLYGKAQCLLRLDELKELPDLYGRLCAVPGENIRADRLELRYLAALGNWQRTAETARRLSRDRRDAGLSSGQHHFWLSLTSA